MQSGTKNCLTFVAAVLVGVACGEGITEPRQDGDLPLALLPSAAATMAVDFTIGPLVPTDAPATTFPGSSGRFHFRDFPLVGPVSGDLVGDAEVMVNANLSAFIFAPGAEGPAWGTVRITTSEGVWSGSYTGEFIGQQGFMRDLVLQGPAQQTIKASCAETTPTSETQDCSGELLRPHG